MCPRNDPSSSSAAQPRPLAGSLSSFALPGELHARALVTLAAPTIHPPLDSDEPKVAAPVRAKLYEAGPQQVDRLSIPQVHLHDPSRTGHAHCCSSRSSASTRDDRSASPPLARRLSGPPSAIGRVRLRRDAGLWTVGWRLRLCGCTRDPRPRWRRRSVGCAPRTSAWPATPGRRWAS
jgi:hypothetical protein